MNMKIFGIIFAFFLLLNAGCGTFKHGRDQYIPLETYPPGAIVKVGGFKLLTPSTAVLDSNNNYKVIITKDGYKQKEVTLKKRIDSMAIIGNIFTAGLGIIVDYYTGSLHTLSPCTLNVQLEEGPKKNMYELLEN